MKKLMISLFLAAAVVSGAFALIVVVTFMTTWLITTLGIGPVAIGFIVLLFLLLVWLFHWTLP